MTCGCWQSWLRVSRAKRSRCWIRVGDPSPPIIALTSSITFRSSAALAESDSVIAVADEVPAGHSKLTRGSDESECIERGTHPKAQSSLPACSFWNTPCYGEIVLADNTDAWPSTAHLR